MSHISHLKLYILAVIFTVLIACSPKVKKSSEAYDRIRFGEAGGITGAETYFILHKNGELFRQFRFPNKPYGQKFVRQTTVDSTMMIYTKVRPLDQLKYKTTGNITYILEFQKDSLIHTITWGFEKNDTTDDLRRIYADLKQFASGLKQ
jgi:hypothetical protein